MAHMKALIRTLVVAVLAIGLAGPAEAALIDRGGGLIYDDDRNVTWLQNANLAATNTFGVSGAGFRADGTMWRNFAVQWVAAMNAANYLGFNDWRLPTALNQDGSGPCNGLNCTGSEMGHLYYTELGNIAGGPLTNTGPFTNLSVGLDFIPYWSGTPPGNPSSAWYFAFSSGNQTTRGTARFHFVLAVRDGDVFIPIDIDIKPGSFPNGINLCSNGTVPIAILGSDTFDVNDINTETLRFAEASVKVVGKKDPHSLCSYEDVSGDFITDVVCHFVTTDIAGLDGESTSATVNGELLDGRPIQGTDSINIVKDTCN